MWSQIVPQSQIEASHKSCRHTWVLKYNSLQTWHAHSAKKCSCPSPTSRGLSTCWVTTFQQNVAMFCILHYYICKTMSYCACRRWHRPRTPLCLIWYCPQVNILPHWGKSNIKLSRSYWDRLQVPQAFGKHINKHMLYVHAISSCDTHI